MTLAFQEELLKYLFQNKEARHVKNDLDQEVFSVPTFKLVYGLWQEYVKRYNSIPTKTSFREYTDRAVKRSKGAVSAEVYTDMLNVTAVAYTPSDGAEEFTRDIIVTYARRMGMRNLFTNNAERLRSATNEDIDNMFAEARRVVGIGGDITADDKNRGGFLFRDGGKKGGTSLSAGHPTFLDSLNRMTGARGFYSPQLILLMGGPKAFKTGMILSILIEYAKAGLNIFIADAENGVSSIETRIKQGLLECERHEVGGYRKELAFILSKLKLYGGDILVHHFPAYVSTLDHVDAELERLATEEQWVPNIIFYDYLQLFASSNKKIINKQDQIQDVYHHAKRMNNKWNTFAFTAIKIKREAVSKVVLKADDIGVDFGQAYNCDATFALCRTEDEVKEGNARIVPVLQREGTAYRFGASTTCAVQITEATQTVREHKDCDLYMEMLMEAQQSKGKPANGKRKFIPPASLRDE